MPNDQRPPTREAISELTTERLSVYLRCLQWLESEGKATISSHELASRFHLNSAQIRKDLANFGELGIRGVGYNVESLKSALIDALGLDRTRRVVILGAGNLGMALADYRGFHGAGFSIRAMFDTDPAKSGRKSRSGVPVFPLDELPRIVREEQVEIGVIAVPADAAQEVYERLCETGVCAILNFAPAQLCPQPGIKLRNVDLRINLEALSFFLKNAEHACETE
ncbi:MAG TPA: redox-sensing transcriptional repressor Rex [Thermoanaerobaculia bacterium]|nr:redox-sensing transcriptional repressor Rex [Thermoanaerobaculia bacterium]